VTTDRPSPVPSLAPLARNVARAFHDDPAWIWVLPDEERRSALLPYLFERALRLESLRGHIHAEADVAVAIWIPPGAPRPTLLQTVRSGLVLAPLRLRAGERLRLRRYLRACADLQQRDLADVWYLSGLAVDPERQRQGIGSALLRWGLGRGRVGLLTSNRANIRFYERFGLRVVGEFWERNGPPRMWTMRSDVSS
jgi:ribosomal protein S18 acetylase RimI-like enzyme